MGVPTAVNVGPKIDPDMFEVEIPNPSSAKWPLWHLFEALVTPIGFVKVPGRATRASAYPPPSGGPGVSTTRVVCTQQGKSALQIVPPAQSKV